MAITYLGVQNSHDRYTSSTRTAYASPTCIAMDDIYGPGSGFGEGLDFVYGDGERGGFGLGGSTNCGSGVAGRAIRSD